MESKNYEWVKRFSRPWRSRPGYLILDCFDINFFLLFDFTDVSEEFPETTGTCDIHVVPISSDDFLSDAIPIVSNADKFGIMRLLSALGVDRFDDKVKAVYYELSNPLRDTTEQAP